MTCPFRDPRDTIHDTDVSPGSRGRMGVVENDKSKTDRGDLRLPYSLHNMVGSREVIYEGTD